MIDVPITQISESMKKIDQYRSAFLKIGFIISLSAVILAFNWTVYNDTIFLARTVMDDAPKEMEIIRTVQQKKKVMPPPAIIESVISDVLGIDDPEFTDEPIEPGIEIADSTLVIVDSTNSGPYIRPTKPSELAAIVEPPKDKEEILNFYQIEKMPFLGDCYGLEKEEMQACSYQAFKSFMAKHIKYPSLARDNDIEGTVHVQFVIGKTGDIESTKILRSIGGRCDEEVLRVIDLMPRWSPGIQGGRPVKVMYTAPVKFELN
jgi:protein TonB